MTIFKIDAKWVLSAGLFFSLFFNTAVNIYFFYAVFTINLGYFLLCISVRKKLKIEPFVYFYLLFFAWSILSLQWARDINLASNMVFRMLILVICIFFTINLNNKTALIFGGFYGLLAGVIINVPLTLFDAFYISDRFSGTTINPNHIGLFSGFVIFLSILNKDSLSRLTFVTALVLSCYLIIQTGSRKGLLLALVSISIYLLKADKRKANFRTIFILFSIGILVLTVFIKNLDYLATIHPIFIRFHELTNANLGDLSREGFGGDGSTRWRLIFIVEAFNIFLTNPFTGIGLDNFKTIFSEDLYSHNNYVELLSTLGGVGFILYYTFFVSIFSSVLKGRKVFCLFIMVFFLLMDFAMVSYFERMYVLPLILLFYTTKRVQLLESFTHYQRLSLRRTS